MKRRWSKPDIFSKCFIALIIFLIAIPFSKAQKVSYYNQQWIQYFNQLTLTKNLTLFSDFSIRRLGNINEWTQFTHRSGLGYQITSSFKGITGIAYFPFYTKYKLSRIEIRPYQEFNTTRKFRKVSVQHRLRIEERYFWIISEEVCNFNFRFRYRFLFSIPVFKISEMKPYRNLLLNIGDELLINAGKEIKYNTFDNNRFLIGLTYQFNKDISISTIYIDQFGKKNSPETFDHSDIFSIGITHKIKKSSIPEHIK